ncbi:hypothetical protein TWF281_007031 [Arthrobotrys megalospora]
MSFQSLSTESSSAPPKLPLSEKLEEFEFEYLQYSPSSDEYSPPHHIQKFKLPRPSIEERTSPSPEAMGKFMDCIHTLSCFGPGADRAINPSNKKATMNSNNIIPLEVPVGHLEPFETRPVVKLPALPDIKNRKVLREVLKIDKKMREKGEGNSQNNNSGGVGETSGSRFKKAFSKSKGDEPSYVSTGVMIMGDVLEDIIASKGTEVDIETQTKIKQSFLTDNQAHYFAICYRMEQHIHHYGDWGTITTKELADVFRGYIGALSSENEIGLKGVHVWLHKLVEKAVVNEIEYAAWLGKHTRNATGTVKKPSQPDADGQLSGQGEGHL